ncbi:hypothetical protein SAMN05216337_1017159 [Bradyrhizobium brasilense]|uniref:DUF1515 domain-containing protein n=1 Tax=Bradyrhizobium brasilense TaxID=1419277 RepID=A0A1G6Z1Z0_9BRAD|nr:hypothetical protein [Bradyrhizobium brasilense]SDD95937.1 hypothetical protein SAMN05216337_1017159 [Bradyrhizobium brasilense]
MTDQEVDKVSSAIGALRATVQHLVSQWEHNDRNATEGRRKLHEKVETLTNEVTKLTTRVDFMAEELKAMKPAIGRVEHIEDDIEAMKPQVAIFDQQHQQGIGSKRMLTLIWTGIAAFIGAATTALFHMIWPKP